MDITKRLLELDPTLQRHNEGFWTEPYDPNKGGFSSFNDAGIEVETGEFLYAMIRLLKPINVLETGTHIGVGAAYMGQAIKDNGIGHLDTIEFIPEIYMRAVKRMEALQLLTEVSITQMDVKDFIANLSPEWKFQLVLLDTEPQTRFAELVSIFPHLDEGGFVFIHDLHRHMHQIPNSEHGFAWPYGVIPEAMRELVTSDKLRPLHFSTPRGLTGFYKVSSQDYQWQHE